MRLLALCAALLGAVAEPHGADPPLAFLSSRKIAVSAAAASIRVVGGLRERRRRATMRAAAAALEAPSAPAPPPPRDAGAASRFVRRALRGYHAEARELDKGLEVRVTRAVGRVGREVRAVGTRAQSVGLVSAVRAHRYWDEMGFPRGAPPPSEASAEAYVADAMGDGEAATGVWEAAGEASKAGVSVWVRRVPGSPFVEVRCRAVVDAPPSVVLDLLTTGDEDTIRTFNPYYESGWDLAPAAAATGGAGGSGAADGAVRVSYARVRAAAPGLKPRDTVTRVAKHDLGANRVALLLSAVEHPAAPPRDGYVRARVVRGMHLLEPTEGGGSTYTFTQQIDSGGARVPACMLQRSSSLFVERLARTAVSV